MDHRQFRVCMAVNRIVPSLVSKSLVIRCIYFLVNIDKAQSANVAQIRSIYRRTFLLENINCMRSRD